MNKVKRILWGIILVIFGALLTLEILDVLPFDVFFKGFWTLVIIVPCAIGIMTDKHKLVNLIGLAIGVVLLLASRGVISYGIIWKLILPVAIIIAGIHMIIRTFSRKDARLVEKKLKENKNPLDEHAATFSAVAPDYEFKSFTGAVLTAVFGKVRLDLRNAVINEDAVIKTFSVFGGVEIILPEDNINVKISSSSVFGVVDNRKKKNKSDGAHTVYISTKCVFGGCEIK